MEDTRYTSLEDKDRHGEESPTKMEVNETAELGMEYKATTETAAQRRTRLFKQGTVIFLASLSYWSLGIAFTYPSVMASDLDKHNTTIYGTFIKLSETEKDLVGSFIPLGAIVGSYTCGWLSSFKGRRICLFLTALVFTVSWIGMGLAPNTIVILICRFLNGVGVGCSMVTTIIYATEVSDPNVRGKMLSMAPVGQMSGQLVIAVLGYFLRYYTASLICSSFTIVMLIACLIFPESPTILILRGDDEGSRKVLRRLRGDHADINAEIQSCRDKNKSSQGGAWKALLHGENAKKLAIIFFLFFFNVFSGTMVLVSYASRIFKSSGSSIDAGVATIIVMAVQVIAVFFVGTLLDSLGRKKTLMGSFLGMAVSLGVMAGFIALTTGNEEAESTYGWVPLVCMIVALISASLGAAPVPFIIAGEYFPTSIRSQASSVWMTSRVVFTFLSLQFYSPMQEAMTPAGLYGFYAIVSLLGIPYTGLLIKETAGKSVG